MMVDVATRIRELYREGFGCSQILILLGLEARGRCDPDLVRSMSGLAGGVGSSGHLCGVLTGGACLLGFYAGKGDRREREHDRFFLMLDELVEWFEKDIGLRCGGVNCTEIADCSLAEAGPLPRCCGIILTGWEKVGEILRKNGAGSGVFR
ncbi:MAG: C-GCAxxG-C-C family protein [Peptococcaceae bacterium]|jgi:C_GCAxxG_C_C family probable redox protein|nr:C-GCAxxG-C-C family protein [Peptococcaceae bacterium]